MNKLSSLSIIIPVFGRSEFLKQALESIKHQTLSKNKIREIIVLDDASPSSTIFETVSLFSEVSYKKNEKNLGMTRNWNHALSIACGDFVHILHDDDELESEFYEKMLGVLENDDSIGAVFCRHKNINQVGEVLEVVNEVQNFSGVVPSILHSLSEYCFICCPSVIIRKSILKTTGVFDPSWSYSPDWDFWCRIASQYKMAYVHQPLFRYRIHSSNATKLLFSKGIVFLEHKKFLSLLNRFFEKDELTQIQHRASFHMGSTHFLHALGLVKRNHILEAMKHFTHSVYFWRSPFWIFIYINRAMVKIFSTKN